MKLARWSLVTLGISLGVISGCRSTSSIMFSRNESNTAWCQFKKVDGVPITVKIPTHLKLYVYDKYFLEIDKIAGSERLAKADIPILRDFAHEMIYTEKVVMVDFKRPAAGSSNLKVDFTEDQYIKNMQQDITDETLQRVNELVATTLPSFVEASGGTEPQKIEDRIKEVKSIVAVGMFDVDDPNFEMLVQQFLQDHVNCSAGCPAGQFPVGQVSPVENANAGGFATNL
ncbi:MAG: hypothetical protein JNM43_11225 [Planctomycetaceae bacterium]|nr:hypothetical protein [Planctomycetaceae bacterium]